jgi:tripartite-type tricarboxylate transporter receptor subunit TctC
MNRNALRLVLALWLSLLCAAAAAQSDYPNRPIQMIVPLSTGTTVDILARMYADRLTQRLAQSVLVQNRPGAGGTIAAQSVAKAAPDGYTLLMVNSQHSINPALYASLPYDTLRDFSGVALVAESPALVYVNPQLGVRTLAEFIALARQKPGTINYGSAGIGTATHLGGAYFAGRAGVDLVHVPYKITSDLVADILTGRIQATFSPIAFLLPQVREGRLLALAVTSRERVAVLPEVPTVSESGIPGYESSTWYGFIAPARTPRPILEQLARALQQTSEEKETRDKFAAQGIVARDVALETFDAYIRADVEKLAPLIKSIGARAN